MTERFSYDPVIRKLLEVKAEAVALGLPESIIAGLQSVEDLHRVSVCIRQFSRALKYLSLFTAVKHFTMLYDSISICILLLS